MVFSAVLTLLFLLTKKYLLLWFGASAATFVLIGAVTNIILDPVFIFGLHMNVAGASIAVIL